MPDREERFRVMLDMVEAVVGPEPRVLDLACGTGSITDRLLKRFPKATSTGVDLDPALLAIARGTFDGDERVTFVTADLKEPSWAERLPFDSYDAVLTATALHWLHSEPLAALYGRIGQLVRDGGLFMNADRMIDAETPVSTRPSAPTGMPGWTAPRRRASSTGPTGGPSPPRTRCSRDRPPSGSRSTVSTPTATCRPCSGTPAPCARRASRRPARSGPPLGQPGARRQVARRRGAVRTSVRAAPFFVSGPLQPHGHPGALEG